MKLNMINKGASEQLITLSVDISNDDAITAISPEIYEHMKRYCNYKKKPLLARSEYAMVTIEAVVQLQDGIDVDNFEERYKLATISTGRTYDHKRTEKVYNYRNRMVAGDSFPAPILMFESDMLIQIDGARRLMARALIETITVAEWAQMAKVAGKAIGEPYNVVVVVCRRDIKSLLEPEFIQKVGKLHKTKKWFNDYQEIIELNLKGKRSYSGRFPSILDFSLFEGKTVAEFACSNGMALFEAYYRGADRVIGFEIVQQNVDIINLMAKRFGIPVEAHRIDFNDPDWLHRVHTIISEWDYSVYLSTYRTLELKDRDGLVRGIWEGSREGMIFEGHQQAIDTDQFYRQVFRDKAALTNYKVTQLPKGVIERPYDAGYRPKYLLTRTAD